MKFGSESAADDKKDSEPTPAPPEPEPEDEPKPSGPDWWKRYN